MNAAGLMGVAHHTECDIGDTNELAADAELMRVDADHVLENPGVGR